MSSNNKNFAGFNDNALAFLVSLSFFLGLGILLPVIILLISKEAKENDLVNHYAKQTFVLSVVVSLSILLNLIIIIGSLIFIIIFMYAGIMQIVATYYALNNKIFEIPFLNKFTNLIFEK